MSVHGLDFANPFSTATVVVADEYVDTFPHPQGLIAYLHRLCVQLDVDIVSQERPVVVKGSWKTIIKIDAFLKTLISTLHRAISKGAVPSEGDFSAAFAHFEEESGFRGESPEDKQKLSKHPAQNVISGISDELHEIKVDEYLEEIKINEENTDPVSLDTWYFNSNPRGKTVDKRKRRSSASGRTPPEPYIVVEAGDSGKAKHVDLCEIEQVLCQVYRKETIEKYQRKSCVSEKLSQKTVDDSDSVKKETADTKTGYEEITPVPSRPLEKSLASVRRTRALMESGNSISTRSLRRKVMRNDKGASETRSHGSENRKFHAKDGDKVAAKRSCDKRSRTVRVYETRRQKNSDRRRITENIVKGSAVPRKLKKLKRCCKKQNDGVTTGEKYVTTGRKALKFSIKKDTRETCEPADQTNVRLSLDRHAEEAAEEIGQKVTKSELRQEKKTVREIARRDISSRETKFRSQSNDKICKSADKKNEKRSHHKKELLSSRYSCDQCPYFTAKRLQLQEHKRRVHLTKTFKCEECLKEFGFRKDLRRHMKCHSKAEHCCDICGKMYKEVRKLIDHKRIHSDDYVKPEFPCKFCTKSFSTKYVLAYHIKSDHLGMKRSYVCPTCGKSFSQKNSYLQHANVHLGIKPFTCEICRKRFSYEKSLKEHKFMHNEEKIFICPMCNKSFRQASGLAIHLKVHKATKDYVCSMCGKGFSQKQALVRHERIHGGEKPYECGLCKRSFADSSVLRRHMILIHKRDPKNWRQDTICHVPKRTDFFISVITGDNSCSENAEGQEFVDAYSQGMYQPQEQNHRNQHSAETQEVHRESHPVQHHPETARSLVGMTSMETIPLISRKSSYVDMKEPSVVEVSNYANVSCSDIKPYVGYGSERTVMSDNTATTDAAVANIHAETTLPLPSSSMQFSSSLSPLIYNSVAMPTHSVESVASDHLTPLSPQTLQLQTLPAPSMAPFVPMPYHQKLFSYDTSNMQPVELQQVSYSAMMAQQPYSQTIVVLQDSLGTVTYHQPGVNIAMTGDTTGQHVQHQHASPAVSLPSSPLPHPTGVSQAITSVSSGQICNRML